MVDYRVINVSGALLYLVFTVWATLYLLLRGMVSTASGSPILAHLGLRLLVEVHGGIVATGFRSTLGRYYLSLDSHTGFSLG